MRSRISLTSIEWALGVMNATVARIVAMPSTTATATEMFGTTGSPPGSSAERSTTTQYVNVPTTSAITRLLNGSRNSVWTTRGEYWLEAN